jgi:ABC-type enterochelin transport system permease subunit
MHLSQYLTFLGSLGESQLAFPLWLLGLLVISMTTSFVGTWLHKPQLSHIANFGIGIYLIGCLWTFLERLWISLGNLPN